MSEAVWRSAAFHDLVRAWAATQVEALGARLTGALDQPHLRPWSSAIRLGTTAGPVWFKVNGAGTHHEPALLALLADRVPALAPDVLAVDRTRGWSLCRDAGPVLRQVLPAARSWDAWEAVAARYGAAQLALAGDRRGLLAAGVTEVSPRTVPGLARSLLDELAALPVEAGGLDTAQTARLTGVLPTLDDWCAELAASPVPDSLQHDDLHSGNVCWTGSGERARVIDWGDATWGCPLGSMLTTMNSVAFHAGLYVEGRPVDHPAVLRVRDAYLEPFTGLAGHDELVRDVDLARRTGCVGKALSYRAALRDAPVEAQAALGFPVRDWLLGLLDP